MCFGKNSNTDNFLFDNLYLNNSNEEVILDITIDNKLTFDSHIKNICKKAGQKLYALSENKPQRFVFNGMIQSQFSYCPLLQLLDVSLQENQMI